MEIPPVTNAEATTLVPVQMLLHSYDWERSSMGPREKWPFALRSSLELCCGLRIPAAVYLGDQRGMFWNDAYVPIAGDKHPKRWGLPIDQVFPELPDVAAIVGQVFATGEPFGATAYKAYIVLDDKGFAKETYWDWSLVPLKDQDNQLCAVLHIAVESTTSILLDRRMTTLNALAKQAAKGTSTEGVCHAMIAALDDAPDISWFSIYVQNDDEDKQDRDFSDKLSAQGRAGSPDRRRMAKKQFRLVGSTFDTNLVRVNRASKATSDEYDDENINRSRRRTEDELSFVEAKSTRVFPSWIPPLPDKMTIGPVLVKPRQASVTMSRPASTLASPGFDDGGSPTSSTGTVKGGNWPFASLSLESPHLLLSTPTDTSPSAESIMMVVTTLSETTRQHQELGVIVAGLNEHRKLDEGYLEFIQSIAGQFETALLSGRAREEDRKATEALKRLNQDRVQFFQNTAHELRTPLTLMLGPLEELVKSYTAATAATAAASCAPPPSRTLSRLSLMSRNARRLLHLVNSILRFSSIEAGKLETRFEPQSAFGMFTRQLAECFEPLSQQSGVPLVFEHGLRLGMASGKTLLDTHAENSVKEAIYIDLDLWEQILFNVLSNAFKNTWEGCITVSLDEYVQDGQDGLRLVVHDTGVGIPAEQVSSIFKRFYRADSSQARSTEGTGIGLSLVRELVQIHGGCISATSELGKGTTFSVWIPRGSDHLPGDRVFSADPARAEADAIRTLKRDAQRWNTIKCEVERAVALEEINSPTLHSQHGDDVPSALTPSSIMSSPNQIAEDISIPAAILTWNADDSQSPSKLSSEDADVQNSTMPAPNVGQPLATDGHRQRRADVERKSSVKPSSRHASAGSARWTSSEIKKTCTQNADVSQGLPVLDPSDRATILVVDDNQDMRYWVGSILQLDYNVIEAKNGREALNMLEKTTPDLVLSDVNMPLVNGIQLVKALRSHKRVSQIPIILISAHSAQDDAIEGLDAGAADYLIKPFNVRDLLARCRVHVRLNRLRLQTREVENELLTEQSRAEAKSNLLGLVSHELRTPLHTIQGAADLLRNTPDVPMDLVDAVLTGVRTLGSRIDQLIDVAQFGSSRYKLAMETFDLDGMLTTALAKHSSAAAKNGVDMFSIVGMAPSQVTSDEKHLLQVLDILLANAVKFTAAGGITLRVWIENARGDEVELGTYGDAFLCFAVTDTGTGIPKDFAATIFQPFNLADSSSTRTHGGTGLGLTLALRLVELAGGQLGVESTLGQGSEFRCRWPVKLPLLSQRKEACLHPEPVVIAVTTDPNVEQSLTNTASTYGWITSKAVPTIAQADKVLSDHTGYHPLLFFIDERIIPKESDQMRMLLDKLAQVRTAAIVNSDLPGTRSYAVVVSLTGSNLKEYIFNGAISPPLHRTHVKMLVTELLSRHRWPTFFGRPSAQLKPTAPKSIIEPASASAAAEALPRGRLLIAEDNPLNAKLLMRQLQSLGFSVDVAEHGHRVLDLISADATPIASPSLASGTPLQQPTPYLGILMDLDMPHMDGFEATRRLRAMGGRFGHLPVLAVSANGSPDIRETVAAAGMDDFLSKPVSIQQLIALLVRNSLYVSSMPSSG